MVVTDRVELDDQIAKTFKATGAVSEAEGDECHASSGAHLRELLRGNHRYVFTLVHKFQTPELLCDRPDVIVLTDEAHRSQSIRWRSTCARRFRKRYSSPLPARRSSPGKSGRKMFLAITSPSTISSSPLRTAPPCRCSTRTARRNCNSVNPDLNEDIYELIENAELDPEQEAKLERELRAAIPPDHPRRPA